MGVILIMDGDSKPALSEELRKGIEDVAREKGLEIIEIELTRANVPPCTGCLHCLTKHQGKCAFQESFSEIVEKASGCRFVIFLTPGLFGTFSSSLKNVLERGGLVIRDHDTCTQLMIGYGEDASDEEAATFTDTMGKHMGEANIVHPTLKDKVEGFFTRSSTENAAILRTLRSMWS